MAINIIPTPLQAKGAFNGGAILENKPIGFPREGGVLSPYSNLFYWAHAWSDNGSTIGEHPHQGFEIMSFVLKGTIAHYDSKFQKWIPLKAGDAQIIRAGNGISHAERLDAGSHIFQIWLDPNLRKTLNQPASYDDYAAEDFYVEENEGMNVKILAGEKGLMKLDSPGIKIKQYSFKPGNHSLELSPDSIYSFYLIEGDLKINGESLTVDDFAKIEDEKTVNFEVAEFAEVFLIESPRSLIYETYASMQRVG